MPCRALPILYPDIRDFKFIKVPEPLLDLSISIGKSGFVVPTPNLLDEFKTMSPELLFDISFPLRVH